MALFRGRTSARFSAGVLLLPTCLQRLVLAEGIVRNEKHFHEIQIQFEHVCDTGVIWANIRAFCHLCSLGSLLRKSPGEAHITETCNSRAMVLCVSKNISSGAAVGIVRVGTSESLRWTYALARSVLCRAIVKLEFWSQAGEPWMSGFHSPRFVSVGAILSAPVWPVEWQVSHCLTTVRNLNHLVNCSFDHQTLMNSFKCSSLNHLWLTEASTRSVAHSRCWLISQSVF